MSCNYSKLDLILLLSLCFIFNSCLRDDAVDNSGIVSTEKKCCLPDEVVLDWTSLFRIQDTCLLDAKEWEWKIVETDRVVTNDSILDCRDSLVDGTYRLTVKDFENNSYECETKIEYLTKDILHPVPEVTNPDLPYFVALRSWGYECVEYAEVILLEKESEDDINFPTEKDNLDYYSSGIESISLIFRFSISLDSLSKHPDIITYLYSYNEFHLRTVHGYKGYFPSDGIALDTLNFSGTEYICFRGEAEKIEFFPDEAEGIYGPDNSYEQVKMLIPIVKL